MAIAAVFRQSLFHGADTLLQLTDQFLLFGQLFLLRTDLFLLCSIFCPQLEKFFFYSHDPTLHRFRLFRKSGGDLSSYYQ